MVNSRVADELTHAAQQAAAGEQDGSPWLPAATALRALAALLRGEPVPWEALEAPYLGTVKLIRDGGV